MTGMVVYVCMSARINKNSKVKGDFKKVLCFNGR